MNCHVTARLGHIHKYEELLSITGLATVSDRSFSVHGKLYEFGYLL